MNAVLDVFCAIGLGPSVLLVVVGFLVSYLPVAVLVHGGLAAAQRTVSALSAERRDEAGTWEEAASNQIEPLFGVRLTPTHLLVRGKAIPLRDLVFVNLSHNALRVVDRDGRGHQVCRFSSPPRSRVIDLAEALKDIVDPTRRKRTRHGRARLRVSASAVRHRRCPYCRDDLPRAEVSCGRCGTGHHAECFTEHGACAILACGPSRRRRSA